MAFEGPVDDRLAIHELVTAYGDAVSCQDADAWGAVWAEDSVWEIPGYPNLEHVEGREAIVAGWVESMKPLPMNINIQTLGALTVTGETATGRTWASELVTDDKGDTYRATGRYDDEFIKRDGRWYFKKRVYTALHSG